MEPGGDGRQPRCVAQRRARRQTERQHGDDGVAGARDVEGLLTLLTDTVDADLLDACPHLKAIANYAVGYDNVDLAACTERGVLVSNTPDVLTAATAELRWASAGHEPPWLIRPSGRLSSAPLGAAVEAVQAVEHFA